MVVDEINAMIITGLLGAIIGVLWLWWRDEARALEQEDEDERWVNETRC